MDKRGRYELAKANSLANWSFIGILFPIIGWILAGMSLSKSKMLRREYEDRKDVSDKIDSLRIRVHISIWLSIFSIVAGALLGAYAWKLYNDRQTATAHAAQESQEEQQANWQSSIRGRRLQDCLDSADTSYWDFVKANGTSYSMLTEYWTYADNKKQQDYQNCRIRNPE